MNYNQFLQLLVAELQHQDPTSPTDPTQYMSQLASFSTVEQQVQTNSTLDALLSAQASTMIGKSVTSADGKTSGIVVSVELLHRRRSRRHIEGWKQSDPWTRRCRCRSMNEADALELLRAAIWTIIMGSGPAVAAAMFVGLIIALFQALTQVQEATLTFVPKIVAIFIALAVGAPFIGGQIQRLPNRSIRELKKDFKHYSWAFMNP